MPIDYLSLTFDDSTMGPAQQALLEGELSVFDTYETEYDLIHRRALTWDAENSRVEIPPGKVMTVTVSCFGKAGWYGRAAQFPDDLTLTNLAARMDQFIYPTPALGRLLRLILRLTTSTLAN